jgi:hypothetical protein
LIFSTEQVHGSGFRPKGIERLKKRCSHAERGFLSFGEWCRSSAFGEGAGLKNHHNKKISLFQNIN